MYHFFITNSEDAVCDFFITEFIAGDVDVHAKF